MPEQVSRGRHAPLERVPPSQLSRFRVGLAFASVVTGALALVVAAVVAAAQAIQIAGGGTNCTYAGSGSDSILDTRDLTPVVVGSDPWS